MKSTEDTIDFLESLAGRKMMSEDKQEDLWKQIQINMSDSRKQRRESRLLFFSYGKTVSVVALSLLIIGIGVTYLPKLTGKITFGVGHPSYAMFKHVPRSQASAIKKVINIESIKNLELPTELPYSITSAHCPTPAIDPTRKHYIDIYVGNRKEGRAMEIEAWLNLTKKSISPKNVVFMNEKVTKLGDGTKALYGNNGHVSQLAWDKDGVRYSISSTNTKNKPDMTEQQLIHVADSFK